MAPFILKWWWWLHSVLALVSIELRGRNKAIERSGIYKAVGEKFPKDLISKSPVGSVPISSSFSNLASPPWTESSTMLFWIVNIYQDILNTGAIKLLLSSPKYPVWSVSRQTFPIYKLEFCLVTHQEENSNQKIVKPYLFYPSVTTLS